MPVIGDLVLLRHLVTNLVDNAVRYNRPGGTVWVRLTGRPRSGPVHRRIDRTGTRGPRHRPRQGGGLTVSVTFNGT
ncbi:ATP-binding protein [Streptomyces canus]|uniref:ATP-binding protein n=1 Tax=Streptomyces canus TaxID=58343 RepID=UPI002E381349|nr:ATP-binding protein [Streptomyces canus]